MGARGINETLKVECLDKFAIVAERHLNYVNRQWRLHYNAASYCPFVLCA